VEAIRRNYASAQFIVDIEIIEDELRMEALIGAQAAARTEVNGGAVV
jgi:hypothetical protein